MAVIAMKPMPDAPSLDDLKKTVRTVPWSYLAHAYHGAGDSPQALTVFMTAGLPGEEHAAPVDWLW